MGTFETIQRHSMRILVAVLALASSLVTTHAMNDFSSLDPPPSEQELDPVFQSSLQGVRDLVHPHRDPWAGFDIAIGTHQADIPRQAAESDSKGDPTITSSFGEALLQVKAESEDSGDISADISIDEVDKPLELKGEAEVKKETAPQTQAPTQSQVPAPQKVGPPALNGNSNANANAKAIGDTQLRMGRPPSSVNLLDLLPQQNVGSPAFRQPLTPTPPQLRRQIPVQQQQPLAQLESLLAGSQPAVGANQPSTSLPSLQSVGQLFSASAMPILADSLAPLPQPQMQVNTNQVERANAFPLGLVPQPQMAPTRLLNSGGWSPNELAAMAAQRPSTQLFLTPQQPATSSSACATPRFHRREVATPPTNVESMYAPVVCDNGRIDTKHVGMRSMPEPYPFRRR